MNINDVFPLCGKMPFVGESQSTPGSKALTDTFSQGQCEWSERLKSLVIRKNNHPRLLKCNLAFWVVNKRVQMDNDICGFWLRFLERKKCK